MDLTAMTQGPILASDGTEGGASSYPGGLVTFGAGYETATILAEDLGVEKW